MLWRSFATSNRCRDRALLEPAKGKCISHPLSTLQRTPLRFAFGPRGLTYNRSSSSLTWKGPRLGEASWSVFCHVVRFHHVATPAASHSLFFICVYPTHRCVLSILVATAACGLLEKGPKMDPFSPSHFGKSVCPYWLHSHGAW